MSAPPVSDHELIRNVIATVSLSFDTNNWSLLDHAFAEDCLVDYPPPLGATRGLSDSKARVEQAISHLNTQHTLSTQIIKLTTTETATAMTYVTANHYLDDKVFVAKARYEDDLVKKSEGWRIQTRKVTIMGVPQGEWTLLK